MRPGRYEPTTVSSVATENPVVPSYVPGLARGGGKRRGRALDGGGRCCRLPPRGPPSVAPTPMWQRRRERSRHSSQVPTPRRGAHKSAPGASSALCSPCLYAGAAGARAPRLPQLRLRRSSIAAAAIVSGRLVCRFRPSRSSFNYPKRDPLRLIIEHDREEISSAPTH